MSDPDQSLDMSAPLTVLCSLLSRADASPLDRRSRASGHLLGRDGQPVADPAATPQDNGFESDPNLNFEHWGEYWRKVHGVRFVHAEEADDTGLERLLRYDQLHRFAPGPTNADAPPYRPPLDAQGRLWPTIVGHVEAYRRPRWDGIAYLQFAHPDDVAVVLGSKRVREKILPEDRALFRDIAPLLTRQYIIEPCTDGSAAVTLAKLHRRAQDVSRDAFHDWWLHEHAPLVKRESAGRATRYVQLHHIGPTAAGEPFFHPASSQIDGVTLLGFANVGHVEHFLGSDAQKVIAEHERTMTDTAEAQWWTAIGMTIVDRLGTEQLTRVDGSF